MNEIKFECGAVFMEQSEPLYSKCYVDKLKEEINQYREALVFYADKNNWHSYSFIGEFDMEEDEKSSFCGKKARNALEVCKNED